MTRTLMRGMVGCAAARGSASRQKERACQSDGKRDECEIDFGELLHWFHVHLPGFVVALLPLRLRPHSFGAAESRIYPLCERELVRSTH